MEYCFCYKMKGDDTNREQKKNRKKEEKKVLCEKSTNQLCTHRSSRKENT